MGAVKRKRKEANAAQESDRVIESAGNDVSFAEQPRKVQKVASSWLNNFLSQKRDLIVPIPPDCELADDSYIREFNLQFIRPIDEKDEKGDSSDEEDGKYNSFESVEIAIQTREQREETDTAEDEEDPVKTNGKLRLFNLPYRITEKNVIDAGSAHDIVFTSVEFDVDKRTSLPAGSATVVLAVGVDEVEAIHALQGKDCGGRPLRVQAIAAKKSRPSGGRTDRYFLGEGGGGGGGGGKEFKCNRCGKPGHKAAECDAVESLNPCHLCAGRDHDSGDCPNITCFRCGEFGHHSRSCSNARRYSKAFICTLCASSTHDARHCMQPSDRAMARIEDKSTRCMRCNQLGHALCGEKKSKEVVKKVKGIFCPNCGEDDHHVDYPKPASSRADSIIAPLNPCQAPKYDAYVKFPQLLRNLGYSIAGGKADKGDKGDKDSKVEYYQSLVRSAGGSEMVQSWFPLLCRHNVNIGSISIGHRGNELELRRSTIGGGSGSGAGGNRNGFNRDAGVSEMRRESFAVSSGITFKDKNNGYNNNNNNNNGNNNGGNVNYGNNGSSSSGRGNSNTFNNYNNNGNNNNNFNSNNNNNNNNSYNNNNNNSNNNNNNNNNTNISNNNNEGNRRHSQGSKHTYLQDRHTDSRHTHLSGTGRTFNYDYEKEEEIRDNKGDNKGSRSAKFKADGRADGTVLASRVVDTGRSAAHRSVLNIAPTLPRRASSGSYDNGQRERYTGRERDSGRTQKR